MIDEKLNGALNYLLVSINNMIVSTDQQTKSPSHQTKQGLDGISLQCLYAASVTITLGKANLEYKKRKTFKARKNNLS